MHFVLISFYAVRNIGDRILTECVSKVLSKKGISSQIVDIQGRIAFSDDDTEDKIAKANQQSETYRKQIEQLNSMVASNKAYNKNDSTELKRINFRSNISHNVFLNLIVCRKDSSK